MNLRKLTPQFHDAMRTLCSLRVVSLSISKRVYGAIESIERGRASNVTVARVLVSELSTKQRTQRWRIQKNP